MASKNTGKIRVPVKQRLSSFSPELKYKIVKEEDINLTEEKAFEFLELKSFEGERTVRTTHVQFLYDELIAHRFLWHNVALAQARIVGQTEMYRINGQHTCWMRVQVPKELGPVDARCKLRTYEVTDENQLRNLYSCFDRGAPRTVQHVSKVMLMGSSATEGVPPSIIGKIVTGFRIYYAEDWSQANINPNSLTGMIDQNYARLFNTVAMFVKIHYDEMIEGHRAAVIGAMFATFEKLVGESDQFWSAVWSGLNLDNKLDARYRLRKYIQEHGHSITGGLKKVSQEDLYRVCILAWNRRNEEVGMLQPTEKRVKAKG